MPDFQVALTGDFLDAEGGSAYGDIGLALLESEPRVRIRFLREHAPRREDPEYWRRLYSMEVTAEHLRGVHGLVVLRPYVRRPAIAAADSLLVIGRSGAGYDKIDVEACTDHGVALFNAPLALCHSTASSALLFMLALAKRLLEQDRVTREGRWDLQPRVMGSELRGRVLGIVGLGHSGRELARLAAPFRMQLLAFSPRADPADAAELDVRLCSLEELLRSADFVSLHCRLTETTRGLIGAPQLALLRPGAYFINVARGELVDEPALLEALESGHLAGAGLDVFETEPLPPDHPLTRLPNVLLSPHWSASTSDVWLATGRAMAEGMLRAARGEVPDGVVNPEVLMQTRFERKLEPFRANARPD